jgi:hypothetical protein
LGRDYLNFPDNPLFLSGSKPATRTIFPQEVEVSGISDTALTQETAESEGAKVKYPKRIKHRGRVLQRSTAGA